MRIPMRILPAALAAVLALPATARAQATDATTVETAILDVLLEQGLIERSQYDTLLAMARDKAADSRGEIELIEGRLARLRAAAVTVDGGAPGKLLFKSPDGKWSMGLKGRIQARVSSLKGDSPNVELNAGAAGDADTEEGVNFSVPRLRVGLEGIAGAENVKYKLEWDMGTTSTLNTAAAQAGAKAFNLKDAFVDWGFESGSSLRFGQFKFPFGREELTSSGAISLMERSIASGTFAPAHEPGAMLHGTLDGGEYEYYLAVSNGDGTSINNNDGESENGLRKGVRLVWNAVGTPIKPDGPAFQTVDSGETKVALGVSLMENENSVEKSAKGIQLAPGITSVRDSTTRGLELQVMSGPWSVLAELFDRNEHRQAGAAGAGALHQSDRGATVQVGYFVVPREWEVVARASRVDLDGAAAAPAAGAVNADLQELVLGVNRYIDAHNAKWMFDIVHTNGSHVVGGGAAAGQDIDNTQLRVQYQAIF